MARKRASLALSSAVRSVTRRSRDWFSSRNSCSALLRSEMSREITTYNVSPGHERPGCRTPPREHRGPSMCRIIHSKRCPLCFSTRCNDLRRSFVARRAVGLDGRGNVLRPHLQQLLLVLGADELDGRLVAIHKHARLRIKQPDRVKTPLKKTLEHVVSVLERRYGALVLSSQSRSVTDGFMVTF